jgi:hypothetical protein
MADAPAAKSTYSVVNGLRWLKNKLGYGLTGDGWAIFAFLPAMALASTMLVPAAAAAATTGAVAGTAATTTAATATAATTTAAATTTKLGVFEGAVKTFVTPVFTKATYTQGIPILGQQIANSAVAAKTTIAQLFPALH